MKGINELILNQATMIEVVQLWLDHMMLENAPKVINIQTYKDGHTSLLIKTTSDKE